MSIASAFLGAAAGSLGLYWLFLSLQRLLFSPLAKFPGSKLAGLTAWVETYYQMFKGDGGQYTFKILEWHDKYGPIVRIAPGEVHIRDTEFFDVLYSQSRQADKLDSLRYRFNSPHSVAVTVSSTLHRQRRAAMNPFFSKQRIAKQAVNIQAHMDELCARIAKEYAGKNEVLNLTLAWPCYTCDNILEMCLGHNPNLIDRPDWTSYLTTVMVDLLEGVHMVTQFPAALTVMQALPESVVVKMDPRMSSVFAFNNEIYDELRAILKNKKAFMEDKQDTLLHTLFQSNLPPEELTLERLHSETISTIGGGTETTGRALSVACFHILDNPPVYQKLLAELVEAIPDPASIPSWADLEKVPYLTACIQETLRLSYGIAERSRRTHDHDITYKNHLIPAGTIISMSLYSISHDESIFPSSYKFQPERWLGNPKAGPDGRPLTRYLVVFSKGTRGCIGMQLAYAELYITLASFFRRFRLSLVDTTRAAVDMWMDRFTPKPNPRSKGVQVMVERM